jgi:hypothetical protein
MDDWLVRLMTFIYPTVIVCGSGLFGFWLKLRHDRRLGANQQQLARLSAQVEMLQAEFTTTVAELHERLDFADRLLARNVHLPLEAEHPTPV